MKKALTFLLFITVCISFTYAQSNAKISNQMAPASGYCDTDLYEPNNALLKAYPISQGDVYFALICDQSDVDWYLINVPGNTASLKVMVTDCPRDYDVEIHDIHSKVLGASYNKGYTHESIVMQNPAPGDYFVKIYGFNNEFDVNSTYALRYSLNLYPTPVSSNPVLRTQKTDLNPEIILFPNPAVNSVKLNYTTKTEGIISINIYDHVGRLMNKISDVHGEGLNTHTLDISYLPTGFYMLEVNVNNEKQLKKLTVDRK